MEQGASLKIDGELLTMTARSDIYVRYLTDNRNVVAELASELYGRRIKVEMASSGATEAAIPAAFKPPDGVVDRSLVKPVPLDVSGSGASNDATTAEGAPVSSASAAARQTQAHSRQNLYADPLVQRIFEEFDARLVEVKTISIRSGAPTPASSRK
jgi:hypothetical protein